MPTPTNRHARKHVRACTHTRSHKHTHRGKPLKFAHSANPFPSLLHNIPCLSHVPLAWLCLSWVLFSLCRNVNVMITSRRDSLSNVIRKIRGSHRDVIRKISGSRRDVIRKISGSRRDVISRQGVISLFSGSRRDVIPIFTCWHRLSNILYSTRLEEKTETEGNL